MSIPKPETVADIEQRIRELEEEIRAYENNKAAEVESSSNTAISELDIKEIEEKRSADLKQTWAEISKKLKESVHSIKTDELLKYLRDAIRDNQSQIIDQILSQTAYKNIIPETELEVLFKTAIDRNRVACVARLLVNGYRPNDAIMEEVFKIAYERQYNPELLNVLIHLGVEYDLNVPIDKQFDAPQWSSSKDKKTLFQWAYNSNNVILLRDLVKKGVDLTTLIGEALFRGKRENNLDIFELFLNYAKLNTSVQEHPYTVPLYFQLLVDGDAQSNALVLAKLTPELLLRPGVLRPFHILSELINNQKLDDFYQVLKIGGAALVKKEGGQAILSVLSSKLDQQSKFEAMVALLQTGDLDLEVTSHGLTPLEIALANGFEPLAKLLEYYGAKKTPRMLEEEQNRTKVTPKLGDPRSPDTLLLFIPTLGTEDLSKGTAFLARKLGLVAMPQIEMDAALLSDSLEKKNKDERENIQRILIAAGANPEYSEYWPQLKQEPVLQLDPNPNKYAFYLVNEAAKKGEYQIIQQMLLAGLPVKSTENLPYLKMCILSAKEHHHPEIQTLLEKTMENTLKILSVREAYQRNKHKASEQEANQSSQKKEERKNIVDFTAVQRTQLLKAIARGDINAVAECVAKGGSPDNLGFCFPSEYGLESIDAGKSGFWPSVDGVSPLHFICLQPSKNSLEMFQLLLDLGANFHAANDYAKERFGKPLAQLIHPNNPNYDALFQLCVKSELKPRSSSQQTLHEQSLLQTKKESLPLEYDVVRSPSMQLDREDVTLETLQHLAETLINTSSSKSINDLKQLLTMVHASKNVFRSAKVDIMPTLHFLLKLAAEKRNYEAGKLLLEFDYKPDAKTARYVLYCALQDSNNPEFTSFFINHCLRNHVPLDLQESLYYSESRSHMTPLYIAITNNDTSLTRTLLSSGVSPNEKYENYNSLMYSLLKGNMKHDYRNFQYLVEAGADLGTVAPGMYSALLKGVEGMEALENLIKFANINNKPAIIETFTPILNTLKLNNPNTVKDIPSPDQTTAVPKALSSSHTPFYQALLEKKKQQDIKQDKDSSIRPDSP